MNLIINLKLYKNSDHVIHQILSLYLYLVFISTKLSNKHFTIQKSYDSIYGAMTCNFSAIIMADFITNVNAVKNTYRIIEVFFKSLYCTIKEI